MRSKNILYALMFASLCLATTGCDKELPLSAASSGDSRGYRVPVFAAQAVGHVQPQNVSINSADKNHEDQVVSLQVVSKQKIMDADKPYYNAENWVANSTNYITFTKFVEKEDEVYYVANLLYDHYFSLDKSSPNYIEKLSRETINYCTPPFIMTAKNLNLTCDWNARKVYTTDNGTKEELKEIVLERSIAGVDVEFKVSNPANIKCKSITVDKVELMNIPDRIGLTQPIQYQEVDSIPLNPFDPEGKKVVNVTSYYDEQDNFLGKKPEDFKHDYNSDIYVPNFIEPLGNALKKELQEKHLSNGDVAKDSQGKPVMETVYSISLGKGIPVLEDRKSKQALIPRRYVPENKSEIYKTMLRFTLTKILNDGNSDTRYYYLKIDKEIKRNTIYKYVVSIDSWNNDIKFSIVSTVRPWTYVKYTEDFDLDY